MILPYLSVKKSLILMIVALVLFLATIFFIPQANAFLQENSKSNSLSEPPDKPRDLLLKAKPEFKPGQVIIKFKDTLATSLKVSFQQNKSLLPLTEPNLNRLIENAGGYNLEPSHKALHAKMQKTGKDFYGIVQEIKEKYPQRTLRAPKDSQIPDLSAIYLLEVRPETDILKLCEDLEKDPNVVYVEPNYIRKANYAPQDPYFYSSNSWGQGYEDLWGLHRINAANAWDLSTGQGAVVAVVDSGVELSNPEIASNIWVNADEIDGNGYDDDHNGYIDDRFGWDFINNDYDPSDDFGHGSHLAGIIAAVANTQGIVGIAFNSKVMAVKGLDYEGSGQDYVLWPAIYYAAENGADLLNFSWGGFGNSDYIDDAVNFAYGLGCVIVASAGNYDMDVEFVSPANLPKVIAVSSTNYDDEKSDFSNYGLKIDVAAPGGDNPNTAIPTKVERNILSIRATDLDLYQDGYSIVDERYYRMAGTSASCPYIAGLAALLLSRQPGLSNEDVRTALMISSDDVNTLGVDTYTGHGRINASNAITKANQIASLNLAELMVKAELMPVASPSNVHIKTLVKNIGKQTANSAVKIYDGAPSEGGTLITQHDFTDLQPNEGILYDESLSGLSTGHHDLYIKVNEDDSVLEYSDENNFFILPIVVPCPNQQGNWPFNAGFNVYAAPTLADIDSDSKPEVIINVSNAQLYALNEDGASVGGSWPVDIGTSSGGLNPIVGDIDGDSYPEIVIGSSIYQNGFYNPIIHVINHDGTPLAGWPYFISDGYVDSPALADVDFDTKSEIIAATGKKVYCLNEDKSPCVGGSWPKTISWGENWGSAAVGNIVSSGSYVFEVVVGSAVGTSSGRVYAWDTQGNLLSGWPVTVDYPVKTSPALGDIDSDGLDEAVVVSGKKVYALNGDGSILWQQAVDDPQWTIDTYEISPVIGDVDADGLPEVVVCAGLRIYALRGNDGIPIAGNWPIIIRDGLYLFASEMSLADIDNDSDPEILIGLNRGLSGTEAYFYAFNSDGSEVSGWPVMINAFSMSSASVGDIDADGNLEFLMGTDNYKVYNWDTPSSSHARLLDWPRYRADNLNSGYWKRFTPVAFIDSLTPSPAGKNIPVIFSGHGQDFYGGSVAAYEWDFGDGTPVSNQQYPTHMYLNPGNYSVRFRVQDNGGNWSSYKTEQLEIRNVTYVWGDVGNQTWTKANSPYIAYGDINVPTGTTLTIEPGVEVRFAQRYSLNVSGTLNAQGTPTQRIVFTSNSDNPHYGDWERIYFDQSSSATTLKYCTIEYAYTGMGFRNASSGNFSYNIFRNNSKGIEGYYSCWVAITNSLFIDNIAGGIIWGDGCGTLSVRNSIFSGNGFGIYNFGTVNSSYNCFWNNTIHSFGASLGTGSFIANPLFVNQTSGNYNLLFNSPAIDTGDPLSPVDPDGTRADIGVFYYYHRSGCSNCGSKFPIRPNGNN